MSKRLHTILNEKYRPDTLEGYICKDETKVKFQEFINKQDIPHLLFAVKPGAGKTTIAKILVENIDCDYRSEEHRLNSSHSSVSRMPSSA